MAQLIDATKKKQIVLFLDEAMFTARSILDRTWRKPDQDEIFKSSKLKFNAIGVLGAIDTEGRIIAYVVRDDSI